jgi:hypothetical protein
MILKWSFVHNPCFYSNFNVTLELLYSTVTFLLGYELDDNIFSIGIGIDVKNTNWNWNLHGKHELELELELIRKTRIGIDSKNRNWNWNEKIRIGIRIGIDSKNTNLFENFAEGDELELELIWKTRIGIGIDSKNRQELELLGNSEINSDFWIGWQMKIHLTFPSLFSRSIPSNNIQSRVNHFDSAAHPWTGNETGKLHFSRQHLAVNFWRFAAIIFLRDIKYQFTVEKTPILVFKSNQNCAKFITKSCHMCFHR